MTTLSEFIKQSEQSNRRTHIPARTVKAKALRTRVYFLAPKLKDETGWNPCPMPSAMLKSSPVQRLTMLNAAIAASP